MRTLVEPACVPETEPASRPRPLPWLLALVRRVHPALALVAATVTLYLVRLGRPGPRVSIEVEKAKYVFDEAFYAFTAYRMTLGDPAVWLASFEPTRPLYPTAPGRVWNAEMIEWTHPPLVKEIMAGFLGLFGFHSWSYRLGSVLAATLALYFTYLLARRLSGERLGLLALSLLSVECLLFVMARTAMTDAYVLAAVLGGTHATACFCESGKTKHLALAALAGSLGLACKWNAGPFLVAFALVTFVVVVRSPERRPRLIRWALWFGCLPVGVYLTTYLPMFLSGHGFDHFVSLQKAMWEYHRTYAAVHPYASRFYEWTTLARPIRMYYVDGPSLGEDTRAVFAIGNPLIVWSFLPALGYNVFQAYRRRHLGRLVPALGFFVVLFPWVFVSRPTFLYHFLPAVPFGVLAVAFALEDLWVARPRAGRAMVLGYLGAAAACFILFYPILSAVPVAPELYASRLWFWFDAWR